jgi:hypothetical protein
VCHVQHFKECTHGTFPAARARNQQRGQCQQQWKLRSRSSDHKHAMWHMLEQSALEPTADTGQFMHADNQPGTKCVTHPNTHAHTHTLSLSVPLTNNCSSRLRARPKERFLLGKKFFLALTGQWPAETVHPLSAQKLLLPQVKLDELIKTNSWTLESCHFDGKKFCSVLNNREPFLTVRV